MIASLIASFAGPAATAIPVSAGVVEEVVELLPDGRDEFVALRAEYAVVEASLRNLVSAATQLRSETTN